MHSIIKQKVEQTLRQVLSLSDNASMSKSTKLKDDLGLDSMTSLTFLMTLEENIKHFVVDPETLDMTDLESIETITNYITLYLKDKGMS